jgi:long-chain acyl-CoA synthetase
MAEHVGQLLRQAAAAHPDRPALVDDSAGPRSIFSYAAVDRAALAVAAGLAARGVGPGDRVALMAHNGAPFVAAWFGIVYAGAVVVPIPTVSAPPEVAHRLAHARCRLLLDDSSIPELMTGGGALFAEVAPGAAAMVLYTSGTTGVAKGALISHAALVAHTSGLQQHTVALDGDDRILGALPLTHSFGCRMVMLLAFAAGARCLLVRRFDAARTLEAIAAERVTFLPAVPTMLAAWSRPELAGEPLPALRWCLSAGAPLADALARRAEARLGCAVRQGYGLTEATFSTINAPPDERIIGSVGKPAHGVEVRVVGGEIQIRGNHVMSGYLDDPAATAAAFDDGWLRTGDVGRLDSEGRLYIVDRTKDLIIRGGNNVYPSEVEGALAAHPDVAEVAVVGRPDDYFGEEVVAVIVARAGSSPSAAELAAFARERVAATKVPREYAFVRALPLGPSGKVLKRALREQLADGRLTLVSATARAPG